MIKIRVPATSANLGSGFDCLGVALDLYNNMYMEEYDGIDISSLDDTPIPTNEHNLVYQTVKRLYEECGKPFPGLRLQQENKIPMARGLGSSSACIAGALVGANHLLHEPLSKQELLNLAATLEGHPDNSTPAILGGFTASVFDGKTVHWVQKPMDDTLSFVAFIPNFPLKTSVARAALPKTVDHKDAVYNLSRAALTAASLFSGKYENLAVSMSDKLHQPYRLPLIRGAREVFELSASLGALTTYLSGAGSTIMSVVEKDGEAFVGNARRKMGEYGLKEWNPVLLKADNTGTTVY